MWILRFHRFEPRDYNAISRIFRKAGFVPRTIPAMVFAKALIFHEIEKKSWRTIAWVFWVSHIALYKFYESFSQTDQYEKIFHMFCERRIVVYVGEEKTFTQDQLDNSEEFYLLTKERIVNMLKNKQ